LAGCVPNPLDRVELTAVLLHKGSVQALILEGVTLPEEAWVGNEVLALNGAGVAGEVVFRHPCGEPVSSSGRVKNRWPEKLKKPCRAANEEVVG